MSDNQTPSSPVEDDPWAAAMDEQAASEKGALASSSDVSSDTVFKNISSPGVGEPTLRDLTMVGDIPLVLEPMLGTAKITVKELLALSPGSIVQLDGLAGAPLEIYANKYLLAKGEVVVINEHYGIRITHILSPSERYQHLAK
jgi:flagellar motor switch protein FliN/FliY